MTDRPWWHSPEEPTADQLGSAAEEAARLFGAMRDRFLGDPTAMRAGARLLQSLAAITAPTHPAAPGDAPECAYCPICQALVRARSLNPESLERLTGAAMEFAETVRQVVVSPAAPAEDRVRHVPLDEDFEDWPEPEVPGAGRGDTGFAAEQEIPPADQ